MTYNVFGGTLNLNQSINQSLIKKTRSVKGSQNPFFRRMCSYPQVTTACRAFHWQILLGCMYRWAQKCNYVINTQTFSKKTMGYIQIGCAQHKSVFLASTTGDESFRMRSAHLQISRGPTCRNSNPYTSDDRQLLRLTNVGVLENGNLTLHFAARMIASEVA